MLSVTDDRFQVEWENIGEGVCGDYDPTDHEDVELLRFTVLEAEGIDQFGCCWRPMDDASYCTRVPADTDPIKLATMAAYILAEVREVVDAGGSVKKLCENLSWISWQEVAPTIGGKD